MQSAEARSQEVGGRIFMLTMTTKADEDEACFATDAIQAWELLEIQQTDCERLLIT